MTPNNAMQALLERAYTAASEGPQAQSYRLRCLVDASALKLGLSDDTTRLKELDLGGQLTMLLMMADSDRPPSSAVSALAIEAVTAYRQAGEPDDEKITGLGLWAGMQASDAGFDGLNKAHQAMAVERALRGGAGGTTEEALTWIGCMLGDIPARDDCVMDLLRTRCTLGTAPDLEVWLPIAQSLSHPPTRAQALLELGMLWPDALPDNAIAAAEEAFQATAPGDTVWPARPSVLLGGAIASRNADKATALLAAGWKALEAIASDRGRTKAFQVLLMAETQRGLIGWRKATEKLATNRPLRAKPERWANVVFDAAGLVRFVRGSDAERSAAINPVHELIARIAIPSLAALSLAALTEAISQVDDRPVTGAFSQLGPALAKITDRRERLTTLPRIARLSGQGDLQKATEIADNLSDPYERVLWLLPLIDVAAGIRR